MKRIKVNASAGSHFDGVANNAKIVATEQNGVAEFNFNGITCLVDANTDLKDLYRDYHNASTMDWEEVGPACEAYTPEVQAELDARNKAQQEKYDAWIAEEERKDREQKEAFEKMVEGVTLDITDKEGWATARANNTDSYGSATLDYAEGWGKLMQIEIAKGKTVSECADSTQEHLNFMGITGFMYGCAVNFLSKGWKHGEELRKWHNGEYGADDSDGVVNPAVITLR